MKICILLFTPCLLLASSSYTPTLKTIHEDEPLYATERKEALAQVSKATNIAFQASELINKIEHSIDKQEIAKVITQLNELNIEPIIVEIQSMPLSYKEPIKNYLDRVKKLNKDLIQYRTQAQKLLQKIEQNERKVHETQELHEQQQRIKEKRRREEAAQRKKEQEELERELIRQQQERAQQEEEELYQLIL